MIAWYYLKNKDGLLIIYRNSDGRFLGTIHESVAGYTITPAEFPDSKHSYDTLENAKAFILNGSQYF